MNQSRSRCRGKLAWSRGTIYKMKVHIGARHLANAIDGSLRRQCGLVLSLLRPLFGSYPYTDRYAAEFDVLRHPAVAAAVVAVYVVVIIVGTLGSLLVFSRLW